MQIKKTPLLALAGLVILGGLAFSYSTGTQLQGRLPAPTSAGGWTKIVEWDGTAPILPVFNRGQWDDFTSAVEAGADLKVVYREAGDRLQLKSFQCAWVNAEIDFMSENMEFSCFSGMYAGERGQETTEGVRFILSQEQNGVPGYGEFTRVIIANDGNATDEDFSMGGNVSIFARK